MGEMFVLKSIKVAAEVLRHHPAASSREHNLTLFLREAGFIPFGLVPALAGPAAMDPPR